MNNLGSIQNIIEGMFAHARYLTLSIFRNYPVCRVWQQGVYTNSFNIHFGR